MISAETADVLLVAFCPLALVQNSHIYRRGSDEIEAILVKVNACWMGNL
jgi:hypothetical protein